MNISPEDGRDGGAAHRGGTVGGGHGAAGSFRRLAESAAGIGLEMSETRGTKNRGKHLFETNIYIYIRVYIYIYFNIFNNNFLI